MKFEKNIISFLTSERFSTELKIQLEKEDDTPLDRISLLENLTKNKKIIHLGCCDHIDLIHEKNISDSFLHKRLDKNCTRCLGVDINKEGINILKNKYFFNDILLADIIHDQIPEIENDLWDYLLLGEVLEHINNPIDFLGKIRIKYRGVIKQVLITVPNAFSLRNFKYSLKNLECINSDHKFWFTPYTLAKIITESGIEINNFWLCDPYNYEKRNILLEIRRGQLVEKIFLQKYPIFRSTIVMEGSLLRS